MTLQHEKPQHRQDMWTYSYGSATPFLLRINATVHSYSVSGFVWSVSLVWFVFRKALLLMPNLPVSLLQLTQFLHVSWSNSPAQGVSCWVHDHRADIFIYFPIYYAWLWHYLFTCFGAPAKLPVEHAALRCFWVFTRDISYHLISPYISPASFRMPTNLYCKWPA